MHRYPGQRQAELYALAMELDFTKLEERILAHYQSQTVVMVIASRDIDIHTLYKLLAMKELYGKVKVKVMDETPGRVDVVIDDHLYSMKGLGETLHRFASMHPKLVIYDEVRELPPGITDADIGKMLSDKFDRMPLEPTIDQPYSTTRGYRSKSERRKNKRHRWS